MANDVNDANDKNDNFIHLFFLNEWQMTRMMQMAKYKNTYEETF